MLIHPSNVEEISRNPRRERRFWHDTAQNTPSLGCLDCLDKKTCGGLSLDHALYNCLGFCCRKPAKCDRICPQRPEAFTRAVREIGGFGLENVPRAAVLPVPTLPPCVPVLYHGSRRNELFAARAVALPLYAVIARHNGCKRYGSAADLARSFGITSETRVILTGTATDPPLERWWSLSNARRPAIQALRGLGVQLVTTPNYSLFTDRPRWDDMHSMKRIAIVHEEFLAEGMPAALHVNARTEKDWDRWTKYIADRSEVTHIAFEFGTGAGWATRTAWHADQLAKLARAVGRPLHLVIRGGNKVLSILAAAFADITVLDTTVFMKTKSRQRAILTVGALDWTSSPTEADESVDFLLAENWRVVSDFYSDLLEQRLLPLQAAE